MTLKEPRTPSKEEQGGLSADSVFDYIYYDAGRIASFLSQFNNAGNLKEIVQSESAERSEQQIGATKVRAGIPSVATVDRSTQTDVAAANQHSSRRVYDPIWANARTFLDYLFEREMIQRNVSKAHMGQFVLCSGSLSIIDLELMERVWKLNTVKSLMKAGGNQARKTRGKSRPTNEVTLVLELLSVLPHTIQAKFSGTANVWCGLSQDGMSMLASDIFLKHGTEIPGKWHALGILDAKPVAIIEPDQDEDFSDGQEMAAKMMALLAPVTRQLVGRPEDHFGITPLLIFREVVGS